MIGNNSPNDLIAGNQASITYIGRRMSICMSKTFNEKNLGNSMPEVMAQNSQQEMQQKRRVGLNENYMINTLAFGPGAGWLNLTPPRTIIKDNGLIPHLTQTLGHYS